jgi:hypothetical protein
MTNLHLAGALEEELEATRRASAGGDIDVAKARVVVRAVQTLTEEHDDLPLRHRGCATVNCDRPPWFCEYRHPDPWRDGGRTDARTATAQLPRAAVLSWSPSRPTRCRTVSIISSTTRR